MSSSPNMLLYHSSKHLWNLYWVSNVMKWAYVLYREQTGQNMYTREISKEVPIQYGIIVTTHTTSNAVPTNNTCLVTWLVWYVNQSFSFTYGFLGPILMTCFLWYVPEQFNFFSGYLLSLSSSAISGSSWFDKQYHGKSYCRKSTSEEYPCSGSQQLWCNMGTGILLACHLKYYQSVSNHTISWCWLMWSRLKRLKSHLHLSMKFI